MKTILFVDKGEVDLWSSFLKYDFLLEEFRSKKLFEVCEWHKAGGSVATVIPDLEMILGDEDEWQAVIATDLRLSDAEMRQDNHYDNLFDFPDRYGVQVGERFEESKHALVRLTQMLGGLPEKTFLEWPMPLRAEQVTGFVDEKGNPISLDREVQIDLLNGYEVRTRTNDDSYDLLKRYRLGLPRPSRIICVTPRDVDEAFLEARRREVEETAKEEYLDFWQRNDYPSSARFVVCNHLAPAVENSDDESVCNDKEEDESLRRSDWFNFWMCVLTLMTSDIGPSVLRAYTVYSMNVVIDESVLVNMLTKRRNEWMTAIGAIDKRQQYINASLKASEYDMADIPSTDHAIPVVFDQVTSERLFSHPSEVRLIKDRPEKDRAVWARQKTRIQDEFRELLRAPRRALYNAAARFRSTKFLDFDELEYCILNDYQKDKLSDDLRALEYSLMVDAGSRPFEYESHQKSFDDQSECIDEAIKKRPVSFQVGLVVVVAVLALIIGFIPYIFGMTGGLGANISAFVVTALCCLVLVGVALATLLYMRYKVRREYLNFNEMMSGLISNLSGQARRLEQKLGGFASFRDKWAILDRQNHMEIPTKESRELDYRKALLSVRIRDIDAITLDCYATSLEYQVDSSVSWDVVSRQLDSASFYNLCSVPVQRFLARNREELKYAGDYPYDFIEQAVIEPLRVW